MSEGFHRDGNTKRSAMLGDLSEEVSGALGGVVVIPVRFETPLMRGTPDHDVSSHGMAKVGEVARVVHGGSAQGVVGVGEMETSSAVEFFSFGEEPVESDDFESVIAGNLQVLFSFCETESGGVEFRRDRERRNFESGIAMLSSSGALFGERTVLEGLVTESKFH